MSDKSEKKTVHPEKAKELMFNCKFCGERKPISELVILRRYYPVLSSCKECSKGPKVEAVQESQT
jgi:transcription elongation factor Elf1